MGELGATTISMTVRITTLSTMTFSAVTLKNPYVTLSITTFSITTLSKKGLFVTLCMRFYMILC